MGSGFRASIVVVRYLGLVTRFDMSIYDYSLELAVKKYKEWSHNGI